MSSDYFSCPRVAFCFLHFSKFTDRLFKMLYSAVPFIQKSSSKLSFLAFESFFVLGATWRTRRKEKQRLWKHIFERSLWYFILKIYFNCFVRKYLFTTGCEWDFFSGAGLSGWMFRILLCAHICSRRGLINEKQVWSKIRHVAVHAPAISVNKYWQLTIECDSFRCATNK